MKQNDPRGADFNRRDFLRGGSIATLMALMGGIELRAQEPVVEYDATKPIGAPVKCGVIGCGPWGRDILSTLARLPQAEVTAVCDTYPAFLKRGLNVAPKAKGTKDAQELLNDKDLQAVVIATPTHKHKDLVLAALKAGKHVYCEAPLAHTVEDARAIAQAAKNSPKQYFQSGLQLRSDPQRAFVLPFVRSGALGRFALARSQYHKKDSWRRSSPNAEREKEQNWRLDKALSPGLVGELGIHPVDMASLFLGAQPVSVSGFGAIRGEWGDDRQVPDTVQAVFEFEGGLQMLYDCTLANSFDSEYEMFYGTFAAIMMRGSRAWLFKEADSPLLGWEVYARKESFGNETGIVLRADASKQKAHGAQKVEEVPFTNTPLFFALEAFLNNVNDYSTAIEDFQASFNINDTAALQKFLADLKLQPHAGHLEGYQATVLALKANEAITTGKKITFEKNWLALA